MYSVRFVDPRRSLSLTTALVSSSIALFGLPAAFATPAHAQAPTAVPPVVVETQKPKPRAAKPRTSAPRQAVRASRSPRQATPAPLPPTGTPGGPASATGLSVPATTATISREAAFSRGLGTSDTAQFVTDIPGGAVWGAGGVSGLPALNGMGADRVQIAVDNMLLGPACPNQMNPPLSFVNPAMVATMQAYVGVAPVSVGGDYTAGKIVVETARPQFSTTPAWLSSAQVSGFYRSINRSNGVDASAFLASQDTAVSYTGGWVRAGDYKAADGVKVRSTLYETQNHALTFAKQSFGNFFSAQFGGQFIPYQGFVNQHMDMVFNQSAFWNSKYEGIFDWGKLEATAFFHKIRHTMGFIEPDKTGDMPMYTRAADAGYFLKASIPVSTIDLIRVGNELHYNHLDDWWTPVPPAPTMGMGGGMGGMGVGMMWPNTFVNINDGRRTRLGTFIEWERLWTREWTTLIGLRNDTVWMNTGDVQGYNEMMYGEDAAAFNALDHARKDVNLAGTALARYEPDPWSLYELGFARKTRAPNLYERYAWSTNTMAMNMIGWFGDGNGYVGNINLVPEKAHTASFTAGWHDPAKAVWDLRVTPYYTYVQDYIDVDRCPVRTTMMTACTVANLTTTNNFVFLQFANHDAWLAGVNIAGKLTLWDNLDYGRGVLRGTIGYVRGERTDGVNLYHVMPINGKIALDHTLVGWNSAIEAQLVGTKDEVSQVRNELTTPSYALINVRTGYQWQALRIDLGVDNLFNKFYFLPLGGVDLPDHVVVGPMGMKDYLYGFSVPAPGRSFNGRLTVKF